MEGKLTDWFHIGQGTSHSSPSEFNMYAHSIMRCAEEGSNKVDVVADREFQT